MSKDKPADTKIPASLEPELLRRTGQGWSPEALATWLEGEHKLMVKPATVAAYLRENRELRALVAQIRAMDVVGAEMDALEQGIQRALQLRHEAQKSGLLHLEALAIDAEMSGRIFRLTLAMNLGVISPDDERLDKILGRASGKKGKRRVQ